MAEQDVGDDTPEEQLLSEGGDESEEHRGQDQEQYPATAPFPVDALNVGAIAPFASSKIALFLSSEFLL